MIDEYQWMLAASLLERYGSLITCFDMLGKMYPGNRRIAEIREKLNQGMPLQQILARGSMEGKIRSYIAYLPLKDSIEIVHKKKQQTSLLKRKYGSKIVYQAGLMLLSIAVLTVFDRYVIGSILSMTESQSEHALLLQNGFALMRTVQNLLLTVLAAAAVMTVYVVKGKRENYLWVLLHRLHLDGMLKTAATYFLVNDLKILSGSGVTLKRAVEILRFGSSNSLVSLLAYHFDEELLSGKPFEQAIDNEFFDDQFHSICLYGLGQNDFERALEDYQMIIELRFEQLLSRVTVVISVFCYSFAAIVIILAYQVLLLPLEMLEGI